MKELFDEEQPEQPKFPPTDLDAEASALFKKGARRRRNGQPLDGVRYHIGLQDAKDPCKYNHVHECDDKGEAIAVANAESREENLNIIVYDRIEFEIIHRVVVVVPVSTKKT